MQSLHTLIKEPESLQKKLRADFRESMKEESFRTLVSKLPLKEEVLAQNRVELEEASTEYAHCEHCKSLLACPNKIKGYAYLPKVQGDQLLFYYRECKKRKKVEEKNKYLQNIYAYDIPREIREASMKNVYEDDKNRYPVLKYLIEFMKEYQKGKRPKGMYLHGNFGCGKTYLIAAMFNELAKENVKSAIIFWPEFLRDLKSSFGTDFKEKMEKIKRVPLLLIDDIGAENTTPWSRDEVLCPLVQYRMSENLPTFFTSNLDMDVLDTHFSVTRDKVDEVKARRIMERIGQMTLSFKMVSENLRK